jgi:16S rRNA (guanine527-N7)-methyltransferase
VFGASLPQAIRYADALVGTAIERGLLGPAEADRIWARHLLNCAPVAQLLAPGATVVDAGSGAGLPGLVIALARPDLHVVLVDAQQRRCQFLIEMVDELQLAQVRVLHQRAEEGLDQPADAVTVRALAALERLVPLCAPLVRPGGLVLAIKGGQAGRELAAAATVLADYDARAEICPVALPDGTGTTTVVRVVVDRPDGLARPSRQPGGRPGGRATRRQQPPARPRAGRGERRTSRESR